MTQKYKLLPVEATEEMLKAGRYGNVDMEHGEPYVNAQETWKDMVAAAPVITPQDIDSTLEERGTRYGDFKDHAYITQSIKRAMVESPNWATLPDEMKEALDMTAHKIGRILNGDPQYKDSWHDIIGYIRLVERDLKD